MTAHCPACKLSHEGDCLLHIIAPRLVEALRETLAAMRGLRGLAFTGSRIWVEDYPEKRAEEA